MLYLKSHESAPAPTITLPVPELASTCTTPVEKEPPSTSSTSSIADDPLGIEQARDSPK